MLVSRWMAMQVNLANHWRLERGPPRDNGGKTDRWLVTTTRINEHKHREEDLLALLYREEQFFATLVAELRNPLAPIANALELLASRSDDPKIVTGARGVIQLQLRQLMRLVDDLLDVSRIARGVIDSHQDRIDVADVVAAAVEIARSSAHRAQSSCGDLQDRPTSCQPDSGSQKNNVERSGPQ
jgi:signal transduction histidine kinase